VFEGDFWGKSVAEFSHSLGRKWKSESSISSVFDVRFAPNAVEKLCFEKSDDFICVLSVISYASVVFSI